MSNPASDNSLQPKYARITQVLRDQILQGELSPGDRLPSFTEMKAQHGIALSTIEKVISTLEQEGLVERQHGRGTFVKRRERQKTGYIGFVGSASYARSQGPFYSSLMDGVHQAIEEAGQYLLYLGTDYAWDFEQCDKVDGVLICGVGDTDAVFSRLPAHMPCVYALETINGITSVGVDNYRAGHMAAQHLLGLGHRRIACLLGNEPSTVRLRFTGYRDALQEAGVEVSDVWTQMVEPCIKPKFARETNFFCDWAHERVSAWLKEGWLEAGYTAIIVQNDVAAIGVMQALQQAGIAVPEQVSVMSFDGTELCNLSSPTLCAVEWPLEQIGVQAVESLNRQIAEGKPVGQSILLPLTVRAGGSVAALKPVGEEMEKAALLECV